MIRRQTGLPASVVSVASPVTNQGAYWNGSAWVGGTDPSAVPVSTTMTGAAAPDGFKYDPVTFLGVVDPIWKIGYNPDGTVNTEPQFYVGIEGNYKIAAGTEGINDGNPHQKCEFYINYQSYDGTVTNFRPIYANAGRDSNSTQWSQVIFDVGTAGFPYSQVQFKAGATNIAVVSASGVFVQANMALQVNGVPVLTQPAVIPTKYAPPNASPFTTTATANLLYYVEIDIPIACTLTGLCVFVGSANAGNLLIGLYKADGSSLLASSGSTAQSASTIQGQLVPFSGTYAAASGKYWAAVMYSSASAGISRVNSLVPAGSAAQGSFALPASITPPTQCAQFPVLSTY